MAKFNSSLLKILSGSTAITNLLTCNLTIGKETVDVTTKDSGAWMEKMATVGSWSMDGSAILDFAATEGIDEIYDDLVAGTPISFQYSTAVSGDSKFTGNGIYKDVKISAGLNDRVEFTFSIEGTGAITKSAVA